MQQTVKPTQGHSEPAPPPVHQLAVLSTGLGWIFHLLPKPVLINYHG